MKTIKSILFILFSMTTLLLFGQQLDVDGSAKITGSLSIFNPSALVTLNADSNSKSVISYFNKQAPGPLVFSEAELTYYMTPNTFTFSSGGFAGLEDGVVSIDVDGASLSDDVNGFFNIGPLNDYHLSFDRYGIQSKGNAENKEEDLFLNFYGNDVLIGGLRAGTKVGIGETDPQADLHIKQVPGFLGREYGLRLEISDSVVYWDVYTDPFFRDLSFNYGDTLMAYINHVNGEYIQFSDRKLKSDIKYFENVLEKAIRLRPASYIFNSTSSDRRSAGIIAQEVEALFPEFVYEKNGLKGVNYAGLSMMAFKAIQEQQEIIIDQQNEIESLKNRLDIIEAKLN